MKHTISFYFFIFFGLSLLTGIPGSLLAEQWNPEQQEAPGNRRYDEAKFYYNQLQTSQALSSSRDNWLKGSRNFRRIYLASPKSALAPSCLFMLGRIYSNMYEKFAETRDLDESISYFKDVVRLFPKSRLADDSYFALGGLYLNEKKNPQKAGEFFREIINNYSTGDMYPQAESQLKILSQEHNIALPKAMMSSKSFDRLSYVLPVKYWSSDKYTRIVIMASNPVNYNEVLLGKTKDRPARLYIDFKKSYIEPQYRAPVPIEDGLLKRIRTGQFSPDTVRVVLDIESIENYKIFSLPDPFRVVIDVHGKTPPPPSIKNIKRDKTVAKHNPQKQGNPQLIARTKAKKMLTPDGTHKQNKLVESVPSNEKLSLAQQLGLGVRTIVIDPGHGGKDPGAMGYGLKEKDIVLALAKQLAPILRAKLGCKVILTRETDVFIPLEERTAIANTQNADIFLSLHVNAHPSNKVRGIETYFLNLSTNAEAMRVAAMENATSTHQMSDLQDILLDIMKNSKITESSRLAQTIHNSIVDAAQNKGYSNIKNLGVKQAPFYVLIGAQMPAILLEVAFITNKKDAKNLKDPLFMKMISQEIVQGVQLYMESTTAQLRGQTWVE
ncbi:MAG: hypothetical protein CSA26_02705 [Desulfobacterales bacterium]|nr:MAG: hypothetical protein CSA26_02705 [Desulfobacterales bacterium]